MCSKVLQVKWTRFCSRWGFIAPLITVLTLRRTSLWSASSVPPIHISTWMGHFVIQIAQIKHVSGYFNSISSIPVAMETVSMDQQVSFLQSRNFLRSVKQHMADLSVCGSDDKELLCVSGIRDLTHVTQGECLSLPDKTCTSVLHLCHCTVT